MLQKFYAIFDEEGIPFLSGMNSISPEQLKDGFLSLIECDTEDTDFKKFQSMTIYEIAAIKGYTVQFQDEPFTEGSSDIY